MSVTKYERDRALSDRLRAVWDAHRGHPQTWESAFDSARAELAERMQADLEAVRAMTWDEFKRLQGWQA